MDTHAQNAAAAAPTGSSADWRAGITDEQILAQEDEIRQQIASTQPLVGERESVEVLIEEYQDAPAYIPKIFDLCQRYSAIRRCRGDGNCFYRAIAVGLGEAFAGKVALPVVGGAPAPAGSLQAAYEAILGLARSALDKLVALGSYNKDTTGDFIGALTAYLEGLAAPGATVEGAALGPLRPTAEDPTGHETFYRLYALRLLTCLELRTNEQEYLGFITALSDHADAASFCAAHVEGSAEEADQLQATALAKILGVRLSIAYLDASSASDEVLPIVIPESGAGPAPAVTLNLLYRPGHYDVAYPK